MKRGREERLSGLPQGAYNPTGIGAGYQILKGDTFLVCNAVGTIIFLAKKMYDTSLFMQAVFNDDSLFGLYGYARRCFCDVHKTSYRDGEFT